LRQTINEIIKIIEDNKVILICDKRFRSRISEVLSGTRYKKHNLQVISKLAFPEFKYLLERCKLLVTDSGGQQEEAAALGLRCLVHRRFTERQDGIDSTASLSNWQAGSIIEFVQATNMSDRFVNQRRTSPSSIVAQNLVSILEQSNE
jgi:UDP-N-acetylglucosamine 2-epimerase (non-hydrolysing)